MKIKKIKTVFDSRVADKEILRMLKKQGDNANISRGIRHYCYFKNQEDLNKFLALPIIQQAQKEPLVSGIGIIIIIYSIINEEAIFSQIDEIMALTTEAGGEYDGWETSIQK